MSSRVSFVLKEPGTKSDTSIFACIYINRSQRFKISTGKKVVPKDWNADKQEVKKSHPNYQLLNEILKQTKGEFDRLILDATLRELPITKMYLISNSKYNNSNKNKSSFVDIFDKFISFKKIDYSQNLIYKYESLKSHLINFAAQRKIKLRFDVFDLELIYSFKGYLTNDIGYFNNTTNRTIKLLKTFLAYSYDKGLHNNIAYQKVKIKNEDIHDNIALTENELKLLEDLTDAPPSLLNARDLFLVLCYTSLRVSDLPKLNGNQIRKGFIYITVKKTKQSIKIPVHKRLFTLLEKYSNDDGIITLNLISDQKLNKHLKELGELVKLNDICIKTRYKGGTAYQQQLKKWELLTTHVGRRTFTTLSLVHGMSSEIVKLITGHKTDSSFKKYQVFADEQLKEKIKVWD